MLLSTFVDMARRMADRPACRTRDASRTYAQLLRETEDAAGRISGLGLAAREPVGVVLPNGIEFVKTLLGSAMAGHAAILLGTAMRPRELRQHIENSGLRLVLAAPSLARAMEEAGGTAPAPFTSGVDRWCFAGRDGGWGFAPGDFICQLTSGTNGLAKAAIRTEMAVWFEIRETARMIGLSADDAVLTIPPIHHSYGLIGGTLAPLCWGARLTLLDGFTPAESVSTVEQQATTIMFAVPFMYHLLNLHVLQRPADFSSLRLCLSAGAPLASETAAAFERRFGRTICQDYGSTETGVMCLNLAPNEHPGAAGIPVGALMQAVSDSGRPLPHGACGGLMFKSEATARAYLYPRELNQSAFIDGWFDTGDLGRLGEDGYVYVTGRKGSSINVAGCKVDPAEVEQVIARLPGVKDVAVLGVRSAATGQAVKAVIVSDGSLGALAVVKHCRQLLSHFKVPRIVEFVSELPRSQTGKILRKYLAE